MKVVYELITENYKRVDDKELVVNNFEEIKKWAENTMEELINELLKDKNNDDTKITVICKSITEY